jgi:glycosyltransferase involved in cell wall biosynthesis
MPHAHRPIGDPRHPLTSLHVVPSLDEGMGGSVQAALSMCDALRRIGVTARIAATGTPKDRIAYLEAEFQGLDYDLFTRSLPRHFYRAPSLHRYIRDASRGIDIVHVHGVFNFPAAYALSVAPGAGPRVVLSPHGQLDPYDLARHRAGKKLYGEIFLRRALRDVSCAHVTSEREGQALETYGVPVPVQAIPLPIAPTTQGSGRCLRARYGIHPDAPLLLFLGRIHPKKRLDIVLGALARIRQVVPRVHLLVVGDGEPEYTREMRELAKKLFLVETVTWTGNLRGSDKADAFAAAMLFVLPSENENFGITVVESLLAGVPVVISDQVYLQEVIQNHDLGAVCRTDVDSCSEKVLELLCDPSRLEILSKRAQAVAPSIYSPETIGARLRDLYLSVLRERR